MNREWTEQGSTCVDSPWTRARRAIGSRYIRTAHIWDADAVELAQRIVDDLNREYGDTHQPLHPDYPFGVNAWVYRKRYIMFEVFGMVDDRVRDFSYVDPMRRELEDVIEEYNWVNPYDPTDRRFDDGRVFVLNQAEQRFRRRSGQVRVYRPWLSWLGRRFRPFMPTDPD